MPLIAWQHYTVEAALSPEEIVARLRCHTYHWEFGRWKFGERVEPPCDADLFVGVVRENSFRIFRHEPSRESTANAVASGTIESHPGGSKLIVRIGPTISVMAVMGFFGLFGLLTLAGAVLLAQSDGFTGAWWGTLAAGLGLSAVVLAGFIAYRLDARVIRNRLVSLITPSTVAADPAATSAPPATTQPT